MGHGSFMGATQILVFCVMELTKSIIMRHKNMVGSRIDLEYSCV